MRYLSNSCFLHIFCCLKTYEFVATSYYVPLLCLFLLLLFLLLPAQSTATRERRNKTGDVLGICMNMYAGKFGYVVVVFDYNAAELFCGTDDHPTHSRAGHQPPTPASALHTHPPHAYPPLLYTHTHHINPHSPHHPIHPSHP